MGNPKANLFIVGAAKAGTTSLYNYLKRHPDIYMSRIKEPHYFSAAKHPDSRMYGLPPDNLEYHSRMIKKQDEYAILMKPGKDASYRGEASPSYLYDRNAAEKIYTYNNEARIIIILRHPIERAVSHFKMTGRQGRSYSRDLMSTLKYDETIADKSWGGEASLILELGYYTEQIKRYSRIFPKDQIKVVTFEDFVSNPNLVTQQILTWLKLTPDLDPEVFRKQYNPSSDFNLLSTKLGKVGWRRPIVKMLKLYFPQIVPKVKRGVSFLQPDVRIPQEAIDYLKDKYSDEIQRLRRLYGIDYKEDI